MLIRNRMARTISPAMTQISIAMPNISPPEKSLSSAAKAAVDFAVLAARLKSCPSQSLRQARVFRSLLVTHDSVQIAHNALRIAVSEENLAVRSLDVDNLVAPRRRGCCRRRECHSRAAGSRIRRRSSGSAAWVWNADGNRGCESRRRGGENGTG